MKNAPSENHFFHSVKMGLNRVNQGAWEANRSMTCSDPKFDASEKDEVSELKPDAGSKQK